MSCVETCPAFLALQAEFRLALSEIRGQGQVNLAVAQKTQESIEKSLKYGDDRFLKNEASIEYIKQDQMRLLEMHRELKEETAKRHAWHLGAIGAIGSLLCLPEALHYLLSFFKESH